MDDDEVWTEFHRVVNMSARALGDWLRVVALDPDWERGPDQVDLWTGYRILSILNRTRAQLDDGDIGFMRYVLDEVRAERRGHAVPDAGHARWHRRLLSLGHDPAKEEAA